MNQDEVPTNLFQGLKDSNMLPAWNWGRAVAVALAEWQDIHMHTPPWQVVDEDGKYQIHREKDACLSVFVHDWLGSSTKEVYGFVPQRWNRRKMMEL